MKPRPFLWSQIASSLLKWLLETLYAPEVFLYSRCLRETEEDSLVALYFRHYRCTLVPTKRPGRKRGERGARPGKPARQKSGDHPPGINARAANSSLRWQCSLNEKEGMPCAAARTANLTRLGADFGAGQTALSRDSAEQWVFGRDVPERFPALLCRHKSACALIKFVGGNLEPHLPRSTRR